ncbi:hypothetical protein MMC20_001789 [Loxospora ochrophaea]|nr:hypothetical protein [Loxospora ochrophaea]
MLVHIYSDPKLLQDIRDELEATAVSRVTGIPVRNLMILTMRKNCSLLHSTFLELLRVHAIGASSRFVREDVVLDDRYLLQKGMVVQMPMAVMHSDPSTWGANVKDFQPRRFLKQPDITKELKQKSAGYRPFGGGASLCPGRHFVTLEVMALSALLVLRYDMVPSAKLWTIPRQKQESLATNVFPPEKDVKVRVIERPNMGRLDWGFVMA